MAASIENIDIANWNEAYAWGDHATEGYLTDEQDPQVSDSMVLHSVAKWNGTKLVGGSIVDLLDKVTVYADTETVGEHIASSLRVDGSGKVTGDLEVWETLTVGLNPVVDSGGHWVGEPVADTLEVEATTLDKWCVGTGTAVTCTADVPSVTETDPKVGALTEGRMPLWNGLTLADSPLSSVAGAVETDGALNVAAGATIGEVLNVGYGIQAGSFITAGAYIDSHDGYLAGQQVVIDGSGHWLGEPVADTLEVGTLAAGQWCRADQAGEAVVCDQAAPSGGITQEADPVFSASAAAGIGADHIVNWSAAHGWGDHGAAGYLTAETDPTFGTLVPGMWCSTDGTHVNCTSTPPKVIESDPQVGAVTEGKWCQGTGSQVDCSYDQMAVPETDPQVGTLVEGSWCHAESGAVVCDSEGAFVEVDPKVGSMKPNAVPRWDGSALVGGTITDASGLVGVGTTTPEYTMQVAGTLATNELVYTSDGRWKQDVKDLWGALEDVLALRPVTYYWRQDAYPDRGFDDDQQVGLIAQEVEAVAPDLVKTDRLGFKGLLYGKLTVLLVSALQELAATSSDLGDRLDSLETENQRLADENRRLADDLEALRAEVRSLALAQRGDRQPEPTGK